MLAALAPARLGPDRELADARESLAYWEDRAARLPRHAIRRRREAREMAARWQLRVAEAERAAYGRGLLGALVLLACERRLPQPARRHGRLVARRLAQAAVVVCVALIALVVTGLWAAVELVAALLGALAG
jgi:hypothetical protein